MRSQNGVKEGPADCIKIDEVPAALSGLSGLIGEMTEPQGILELSGYWIYVSLHRFICVYLCIVSTVGGPDGIEA